MKLNSLRNKINKIDVRLISLLAKRQSMMPIVGEEKRRNGIEINQPKREKEIMSKLEEIAKAEGLDIDLTRKIFKAVFKNSKDIQRYSQ